MSCFCKLLIWTTAAHTRSPSPELSLLWKPTLRLVSSAMVLPLLPDTINNLPISGLQTPRLKRLAEIVSAQAIAQQEKMEYGSQDGYENGALEEVDEIPEPIEASA